MLVGGGPVDVVHDQTISNGEARLAAELGVTPWFAAGMIIPVRLYTTSIHYLDANGADVAIENPTLHHRNETLIGAGDPWLYGRAATHLGGVQLAGRLGMTLPLGRTVEDPFALGDQGISHQHSQFGTGALGLLAGIDASKRVAGVHLDATLLTLQTFYANDHAYQAGDRYAAALGATSGLGTKRWRFRATLETVWETAETWGGVVHTDDGNIGRTDVLVGGEVTWQVTDAWHLGVSVKLPAYTHVKGGQLDALAFAGLSVGTRVKLFEGPEAPHRHAGEDDHDHDHDHDEPGHDDHEGDDDHEGGHDDHGDDHVTPGDWTGLDKLDISTDGSAVPLVPVVGKITVFDFWATWCKPCGVVDHELAELARRYPNDVAVRKVNVVDNDSPASRQYVGAATLPHLKVFGRDGKLLWERSAAPRTLTGAVEAAITAK